jgi:hypothetical protein
VSTIKNTLSKYETQRRVGRRKHGKRVLLNSSVARILTRYQFALAPFSNFLASLLPGCDHVAVARGSLDAL